jgi:sulfatase maturation enzyme AslB (radical SAM superfamily)
MSPELFTKILTEAREIPQPFIISPFKLGEPMLDPLFSQRLVQIDEQVPKAWIELHTNLNHMPNDLIPTLLAIKRMTHIWISLNQRTSRLYKDETGLDFDKTLKNIRQLIEAGIKHQLVIGRVASYSEEDRKWSDWGRKMFPEPAIVALMYRGRWCNNIDAPSVAAQIGPCRRTQELSICCDGKVALCCMDGLCEYQLGDVTTDHILDVFNSPQAKAMRQMKVRTSEPCKSCTFV